MITGRFVSAVLFSILVPLLAVALGGAGDVGTQYLITLILIWSLFAIGFDLVLVSRAFCHLAMRHFLAVALIAMRY